MQKEISFTVKEQSFPPGTAGLSHYNVWVDGQAVVQASPGALVAFELVDGTYVAHVQAVDTTGANVGAQVDSNTFVVTTPQPIVVLVPDVISVV